MFSTRRRGVAAALAVAGASAGFAALQQPAAEAAACSATKSSTVSLHGIANEYEFLTHYTQSGQVVVDPREYYRKNVKTGSVSVTILACKNPKTRKWAPLNYTVSTDLRDLTLVIKGKKVTPRPADDEIGFGTMVSRVTSNRVEFQPLVCRRKPAKLSFLGALKFVTGLPIPAGKAVSIGLYLGSNALPEDKDTYPCGLLGAVTKVPYSLNSKGVAQLKMPRTKHYLYSRRATWQTVCPPDRYCGVSHDMTLEVKSGTK